MDSLYAAPTQMVGSHHTFASFLLELGSSAIGKRPMFFSLAADAQRG